MDWCYNAAGTKCSGKAQLGTRNLRAAIDSAIEWVGDYGIYNCRPTRTGSSLSLHGEGRAWDAAVSVAARQQGLKLAQFFVDAAQMLGVQRVIYWEREWDSRDGQRYWSSYSGPNHHDHVHVELCWEAAQRLTTQVVNDALAKYWTPTEEDFLAKLTEAEQQELLEKVRRIDTALIEKDDAVVKAVTGRSTGGVMSGIFKLLSKP